MHFKLVVKKFGHSMPVILSTLFPFSFFDIHLMQIRRFWLHIILIPSA